MARRGSVTAMVVATVLATGSWGSGWVGSAGAAPPPVHALALSGDGAGLYPAFDPDVERYGVTTSDATRGAVTVTATTDDPAGRVLVDGVPATAGSTTVTGLEAGDEISVVFDDAGGREVHSLVYLPAGFPALEAVVPAGEVAPGLIGLTLSTFTGGRPTFMTVVDRNGVPAYVESVAGSDVKVQPNGHVTMSRPTAAPGRTGSDIVELDDQWEVVGRHRTVGLVDTDGHDSILLPDGTQWLLAYEPNANTGLVDSVVQEIDPDGDLAFQWSTGDDPAVAAQSVVDTTTIADYAHANSIDLAPDGDVLVSFRHLSSVYKIATSDHDGLTAGDVVWKLGGRDSTFDVVGDPLGGPCAQHTATELADGHVLVFDDGSDPFLAGRLCVDQTDPTGPAVERSPWQSRVAEYALDPDAGTATLVWDYQPSGRYTWFMGSARRLANGNTLVGWSAATQALATEVAPDRAVEWELRLKPGFTGPPHFSYRASLMDVPDAIDPEVEARAPAAGEAIPYGATVRADFSCTDTGGSSLQTCAGDVRPGDALDTTAPGAHTLRMTATDGAGNTTTVERTYTVGARPVGPTPPTPTTPTTPEPPSAPPATYRPDATIRTPGESAVGRGRYAGGQVLRRTVLADGRVAAVVRVHNEGDRRDRFVVAGAGGTPRFGVGYRVGGDPVTRAVARGTYTTTRIAPGGHVDLRVVVTRLDRARRGDQRRFAITVHSVAEPRRHDRVALVVRAKG